MKNWSLNSKIYFIVFIMAVGLCSVSVIGVIQMSNINAILEKITQERVKNLVRTHKIMSQFYIQIINERNYILHESVEARTTNKGYIKKRHGEMIDMIEAREKISTPEGLKDLLEFKDVYGKWAEFNIQIQQLVDSGQSKEAAALVAETGRKLRLHGEDVLKRMNDRDTKRMDDESAAATAAYERAKLMVTLSSIVALILGLGLAIKTLRSLSKTIDNVIGNLSENSNQVTSAATQIAASSEELSQSVTEQAASLEETASSIEEMSSMVQKNAENARQATAIANGSRESASRGQKVVVNMITAIDEIDSSNKDIMQQINESNQQISEIVNVIKEIESKTNVINDIVFQTKLLSFNASVEAARAGEQGKGFAVVAEEVGSLAQMSGNAANEISVLLDNSIHKVEAIVKNTQEKVSVLIKEGSNKVEAGTRIAKECGDVLEEIVDSTVKVTKMTDEISIACQEQSMGVQEITKAMNMLDQVTQANATSSEEAAGAAEHLSVQATSLKGVVDLLMLTIHGGVAVEHKASPAGNVLSFKAPTSRVQSTHVPASAPKHKTVAPSAPLQKKAVGMNNSGVPSSSDSRFEDV